jgi:adenosine kinase
MKILVVGSIAYDFVMKCDFPFGDVLPAEKMDHLSVCLTTTTQKIHFGGCAGNIGYTLKLLGGDPLLFGVAGKDFDKYQKWLAENEIDPSTIHIQPNFYTASAYILTDSTQQQITIFHIGAMGSAPEALRLSDIDESQISWAIIAPDDQRRMVRLAKECAKAKIPYIFDPGQQIGNLSAEDLRTGIQGAEILIVNEYEARLVSKKLAISAEKLASMVPNYIETHGAEGCIVHTSKGTMRIPAYPPLEIVDPTGCGDAFRAGVLAGLSQNLSLEEACRIGALAATYNLEQEGTQNHRFTREEFLRRMESNEELKIKN